MAEIWKTGDILQGKIYPSFSAIPVISLNWKDLFWTYFYRMSYSSLGFWWNEVSQMGEGWRTGFTRTGRCRNTWWNWIRREKDKGRNRYPRQLFLTCSVFFKQCREIPARFDRYLVHKHEPVQYRNTDSRTAWSWLPLLYEYYEKAGKIIAVVPGAHSWDCG